MLYPTTHTPTVRCPIPADRVVVRITPRKVVGSLCTPGSINAGTQTSRSSFFDLGHCKAFA